MGDAVDNQISAEDKRLLLQIAHESITAIVSGTGSGKPHAVQGALSWKRGCFVTLKIHGKLRGCIGTFSSEKPLSSVIQEMAVSAATRDPRFYPLRKEELEDLEIEISVLSPLKRIDSVDEIQVGIHGLYIEKDLFRGVLLPQVAVEYGWDRTAFLEQTCLKAGLEKDAWKKESDIYIFSAEIFGTN